MPIMLADVGGSAGVSKALGKVSVPKDVIAGIIRILEQESTSLEGGSFNSVPSDWFGGRFSGQNLGSHTDMAHRRLSNSILEAVASLQATGDAIETFDKELADVDASSESATTALLSRTQQAVDQLDDDRNTPPATPTEGSRP